MHPIIAVVGPTASGKSDLALSLAERLTARLLITIPCRFFAASISEAPNLLPRSASRVPHHMIDIRDPADLFTAGDYQREARAVLEDIRRRGRVPVLVGGTGLYLRALTEGLFPGPDSLHAIGARGWRRLQKLAAGNTFTACCNVWIRMQPERIAARDKPKIIRALEVRLETGKPLTRALEGRASATAEGLRDLHGWSGSPAGRML